MSNQYEPMYLQCCHLPHQADIILSGIHAGMDSTRKVLFVLLLLCSIVCVFIETEYGHIYLHHGLASFKLLARKHRISINDSQYVSSTALKTGYFRITSKYRKELYRFANSIKFNVTENGSTCKGRRFLVYTCRSVCGGWGDRQKGITTMFLMALLTNRTFVIDMPKPCNILNFLRPNIYDWRACLATVKNESHEHVYHTQMMNGINLKRLNDLLSKEKTQFPVISMQTNAIGIGVIRKHNLSKILMPWLSDLSDAEVTWSILGMLFKPTEDMYTTLVQFFNDNVGKKKLICAHIRYGKNPTIPNDSGLRFGAPNVSSVLTFLKTFDTKGESHAIFVATDSDQIRNQSRSSFSNYISTGRQIVHVDKTKSGTSQSCDGFFTAIFEQWLLSKCDVLALTRSNFGTMAAYMRGDSDSLYLYMKRSNDILKVNVTDIQKMYNFV